jgi:hypothetical protein
MVMILVALVMHLVFARSLFHRRALGRISLETMRTVKNGSFLAEHANHTVGSIDYREVILKAERLGDVYECMQIS